MEFGVIGFNLGGLSTPDSMERVVVSAEQLGYESVWSGEHVVISEPDPSSRLWELRSLDTIASLAFAAAKTERIKIGSGILLLPQRDPVVLAKELAGIDVLSKGRLLVGIGVGYVPGEFEALGIPYEERGARTNEHIEVLRTLWTEEWPTFDGRFTKFSGIQSLPRPVQDPHPPILVGGCSKPALRRAVAQGDGWFGMWGLEETKAQLKELEEIAKTTERPESLGPLEITVAYPGEPGAPDGFIGADTVKRFEDLGVDRFLVSRITTDGWYEGRSDATSPPGQEVEDRFVEFMEKQAAELGLPPG